MNIAPPFETPQFDYYTAKKVKSMLIDLTTYYGDLSEKVPGWLTQDRMDEWMNCVFKD